MHKFFYALLLYSSFGYAVDIEVAKTEVTFSNSEDYGIKVKVESEPSVCGVANEVYILFPEYFEEAKAESAYVSLFKDEELLLEAPTFIIKQDEYMGFAPFHGVVLCIGTLELPKVAISVSYRRGGFATSELNIKTLDEIGNINWESKGTE